MTETSNASNGGKTADKQKAQREHGLSVLREKEAKALVSLATDALNEALGVGHEMFHVIYQTDQAKVSQEELFRMRDDALACLSTSEHYLLMLGSILEDQAGTGRDPWDTRAPYPTYMTSPEVTDGRR